MGQSPPIIAVILSVSIVLSAVLGVGGAVAEASSTRSTPPHDESTTEVVVVFENSSVRKAATIRSVGGEVVGGKSVDILPMFVARLSDSAISRLQDHPDISYITNNSKIYQTASQSTPWGIQRIDSYTPTTQISVESQRNVTVAIIDTGIDYNHYDLVNNVVWGVNTVGDRPVRYGETSSDDSNGHGTMVAGVVAAEDNDKGVVGVAPQSRLYAIKSLNDTGSGTLTDIIEGIDLALKGPDGELGTGDDADVISMSFGGMEGSRALEDAIQKASSYTLLVAAAGNTGDGNPATNNVSYPARYEEVIGVAATDSDDEIPKWSSEGPDVELAAPGARIRSTYFEGTATGSGTSFAAPHVTGTIALVLAKDLEDGQRDLHSSDIRKILHETAKDIGPSGVDNMSGWGLIQADEAVGISKTNSVPFVHIRQPSDGEIVEEVRTVRISASDEETSTPNLNVEVSVDSGPWQSTTYDSEAGDYKFNWDTTTASEDTSHTIVVRVTDQQGAVSRDAIQVTVNNTANPPTLQFIHPTQNARVNGTVPITVSATDPEDPVTALSVYIVIGNGSWHEADYVPKTGHFSYNWNTTNATEDETQTISAKVVDSSGLTKNLSRTVFVDKTNNPPHVSLTSPDRNNSSVAGSIPIQVQATDDRTPTSQLEARFRIDGGSWHELKYNSTANDFHSIWNSLNVNDGAHNLTVWASDGTLTATQTTTVRVANARLLKSSELAITTENQTISLQENVSVTFTTTNTGQDTKALAVRLTHLPSDWEILSQSTSPSGSWVGTKQTWFWASSIASNQSVTASISLSPSANATTGRVTVGAVAIDEADHRAGAIATINVSDRDGTLSQLAGQDGRFSTQEVLEAISAYNQGKLVAGRTLGLEDVLHIISLYNRGAVIQ